MNMPLYLVLYKWYTKVSHYHLLQKNYFWNTHFRVRFSKKHFIAMARVVYIFISLKMESFDRLQSFQEFTCGPKSHVLYLGLLLTFRLSEQPTCLSPLCLLPACRISVDFIITFRDLFSAYSKLLWWQLDFLNYVSLVGICRLLATWHPCHL